MDNPVCGYAGEKTYQILAEQDKLVSICLLIAQCVRCFVQALDHSWHGIYPGETWEDGSC
jgi:hypothetical protein